MTISSHTMSDKDAAALSGVLEYLVKQNRPYSVTDIFNNLHKEYGKTAVQKACDVLVKKGNIKEKTYGKQKVYVINQSQYPPVNDEELRAMDVKINELSEKIKTVTSAYKKLDTELKSVNSTITTEDAIQQNEQLTGDLVKYRKKQHELKTNAKSVSPAEREVIMKSRAIYVKEWRKRKRVANDILNAILEGYPKKKKDLYEDIGIETDEEYNVKPPES